MNYIEAQNIVYQEAVDKLQRVIVDLETKLIMQRDKYSDLLKKYDAIVGCHAISSDT